MNAHLVFPLTPACRVEPLPFRVKVVESASELQQAVRMRHAAYERHVPELAAQLSQPELADNQDEACVFLAQSKLDNSPLGTMRMQTNRHAALPMESSITLPAHLRGKTLVEICRFGVAEEQIGRMVFSALCKAAYLFCLEHDVDYMVVTARAPVDRLYRRMLLNDVFPGRPPVNIPYVGNLPHYILELDVKNAETQWSAVQHHMLDFMVNTLHPDIDLTPECLAR